jgi:hypothetical protein
MLLFRSEEHVQEWLAQRGLERGGLLSVGQCWALADAWHANRLDPAWQRHPAHEAQALFDSIGLRGAFWRL